MLKVDHSDQENKQIPQMLGCQQVLDDMYQEEVFIDFRYTHHLTEDPSPFPKNIEHDYHI